MPASATTPRPARRRVVIDSDAANEVDDQFAIAWALLASDRLQIEGVHAAPYSHGVYFDALARASRVRGGPSSEIDRVACAIPKAELTALLERTAPAHGMEKSHAEILRVFAACGAMPGERVRRGSERFMRGPEDAVESEAARHLIEVSASATAAAPLYVAVIGAATNVASALLLDPSLAERIVVLFVAGYPSGAGLVDDSFNLVQDRIASNVLFESEVRLVYLPGYQVAQLLQLSLPDAQAWLAERGTLGTFLYETYRNNPLDAQPERPGRSWILWDMITTAWLIDEAWVPTREVPRAHLDDAHRWHALSAPTATMQEAYRVDRNRVFADFFERLAPVS